MPSTTALVITLFALAGFSTEALPAQSGVPIVKHYNFILELGLDTLRQRLSQVAAAVYCEIRAAKPFLVPPVYQRHEELADADPTMNAPGVATSHDVTLLDVLRSNGRVPAAGRTLTIVQPAGTTTWNGRMITVDAGFDHIFVPGERYVLLLKWNPSTGLFSVTPFDVFQVQNGIVKTNGLSPYARGFSGSSLEALLTAIRWGG